MTGPDIIRDYRSPNANARKRGKTDMLILHYTGLPTLQESLERLCDPESEVSAHYLIAEDGAVYGLVDEDKRAWHAGVAYWAGEADINSRSVGIELQNPGHEWGYHSFPVAQIESLIALSRDILARHDIPARHVLGHCDVAPARKMDPGELFPWKELAEEGIGLWPDIAGGPDSPAALAGQGRAKLITALADFGYDVTEEQAVLRAFLRHWQPQALKTGPDENSLRIAEWLAASGSGAAA